MIAILSVTKSKDVLALGADKIVDRNANLLAEIGKAVSILSLIFSPETKREVCFPALRCTPGRSRAAKISRMHRRDSGVRANRSNATNAQSANNCMSSLRSVIFPTWKIQTISRPPLKIRYLSQSADRRRLRHGCCGQPPHRRCGTVGTYLSDCGGLTEAFRREVDRAIFHQGCWRAA